mgnify:CR=1 FL=1
MIVVVYTAAVGLEGIYCPKDVSVSQYVPLPKPLDAVTRSMAVTLALKQSSVPLLTLVNDPDSAYKLPTAGFAHIFPKFPSVPVPS